MTSSKRARDKKDYYVSFKDYGKAERENQDLRDYQEEARLNLRKIVNRNKQGER